ncbi:MAG: hypothetical protein U0744_06100 [Gemmataceae bacterium]
MPIIWLYSFQPPKALLAAWTITSPILPSLRRASSESLNSLGQLAAVVVADDHVVLREVRRKGNGLERMSRLLVAFRDVGRDVYRESAAVLLNSAFMIGVVERPVVVVLAIDDQYPKLFGMRRGRRHRERTDRPSDGQNEGFFHSCT